MKWMERMFMHLIDGNPPSLVDLPTGAGKTDLIIIWLIALAWYAQHRGSAKPVPRRLVWVVNRRVLVQQVDEMARDLAAILDDASEPISNLVSSLRSLCRPTTEKVFCVVQLRGQRVDDREWSLDPTVPQLIIGTVDQIGSRLLFHGYGQGKWARPMQAALLGVDAWVCIDEAHLVPAFAVTLRQVRELATRPLSGDIPQIVKSFFDHLPFWVTELSATPGLPSPRHGTVFRLESEDETDEIIADRLLAKKTRRVLWKPQPDQKTVPRDLAAEALRIAQETPGSAIAVFCFKARDAKAVAKSIAAKYKGRVVLVTGRIRGYERDRLGENKLFHRFRQKHTEPMAVADAQPAFLVGTSAAEVGLDADASAIVCDFGNLLTLTQRLGRLDRRGQLSRLAAARNGVPPTMTIIGGFRGKTTDAQLQALAAQLKAAHPPTGPEYGAEFFLGAPWSVVVGKDKVGGSEEDDEPVHDESDDNAGKKPGVPDAKDSATWRVLGLPLASAPTSEESEKTKSDHEEIGVTKAADADTEPEPGDAGTPKLAPATSAREANPAYTWLNDKFAPITAGPVVVPPLTLATLQRWAATTARPSRFLPVHPWLYGLLPDEEGAALVGIAFRLEIDILQHCCEDEDVDERRDQTWERVHACLAEFPPLRSELHFVPLGEARAWVADPAIKRPAMAHFDGDEWSDSINPKNLQPDSVLVLPTSADPSILEAIFPTGEKGDLSEPTWDVFNALASDGARYRRQVETKSSRLATGRPGAYQLSIGGAGGPEEEKAVGSETEEIDCAKWKPARTVLRFAVFGIEYKLRYWKPRRSDGSGVSWLVDHLNAAGSYGEAIAKALDPGNPFIERLLSEAGEAHDIGKDNDKWQRAMGNTSTWRNDNGHDESVRLAKPVVERPGSTVGYRHEWGTLWMIKDRTGPPMLAPDEASARLWWDLYLHLIAAHHGYFRPSMPDRGLNSPPTVTRQNPVRLMTTERYARLQRQLGYWRLAYLESLLKTADVAASRETETESVDED